MSSESTCFESVFFTVWKVSYSPQAQTEGIISELFFKQNTGDRNNNHTTIYEFHVAQKKTEIFVYSVKANRKESVLLSHVRKGGSGWEVYFRKTPPECGYINVAAPPSYWGDQTKREALPQVRTYKPIGDFIDDRHQLVKKINFLELLCVSQWLVSLERTGDGELQKFLTTDHADPAIGYGFELIWQWKYSSTRQTENLLGGLNISKKESKDITAAKLRNSQGDHVYLGQIILAAVLLCDNSEPIKVVPQGEILKHNFTVCELLSGHAEDEKPETFTSKTVQLRRQSNRNVYYPFEYHVTTKKNEISVWAVMCTNHTYTLVSHVRQNYRSLEWWVWFRDTLPQAAYGDLVSSDQTDPLETQAQSLKSVPQGSEYKPLKDFIASCERFKKEDVYRVIFPNSNKLWFIRLRSTENGKTKIYTADDVGQSVRHGFELRMGIQPDTSVNTSTYGATSTHGSLEIYKQGNQTDTTKAWDEYMDEYLFIGQIILIVTILCDELEDTKISLDSCPDRIKV